MGEVIWHRGADDASTGKDNMCGRTAILAASFVDIHIKAPAIDVFKQNVQLGGRRVRMVGDGHPNNGQTTCLGVTFSSPAYTWALVNKQLKRYKLDIRFEKGPNHAKGFRISVQHLSVDCVKRSRSCNIDHTSDVLLKHDQKSYCV